MEKSLYPSSNLKEEKSRRYIFIKVKNVSWIINRISTLFRRRKYFMIEFSVDLKKDSTADIVVIIDWELFDINQIVSQVSKMYDVIECFDVSEKRELLYYNFCVDSNKDSLWKYEELKSRVIKLWNSFKIIYLVNVENKEEFQHFLEESNYEYKEKLMTLF
jgi:DNA-binding Lrp family transcriptional regulator